MHSLQQVPSSGERSLIQQGGLCVRGTRSPQPSGGPGLRARPLCFGPGPARGGGCFVRGAASPSRAGPGGCGALAAAAPGRLHFVRVAGGRGTRRSGAAALSPASRRRQALGAGGGGMRSAGPPGHLRAEAAGPREERAAWRVPDPLRAYSMQPSGGWLAPDLPRRLKLDKDPPPLGRVQEPCR